MLHADRLPISHELVIAHGLAIAWECALGGGDDYELLFSAPPSAASEVSAAARGAGVAVTRIGRIEAASGLRIVDGRGAHLLQRLMAFDHFRTEP